MRPVPSLRFIPLTCAVLFLLGLLLVAWPAGSPGASETDATSATRLLRFPTLSRDSIAFVYAGDIWTVARSGGLARRLTADPGWSSCRDIRPMGRGSHSPASTTGTVTCTSFRPKGASRNG